MAISCTVLGHRWGMVMGRLVCTRCGDPFEKKEER